MLYWLYGKSCGNICSPVRHTHGTRGFPSKMVLAFLCHSLSGSPCRILFSSVFGDDLQLQNEQLGSQESLRTIRKEQFLQLSCRVQAEYGFREACKEQIPKLKDEYVNVGGFQDAVLERGLFRLPAGDPFPAPKMVVWLAKNGCAYVLVCEVDENYMQAEAILVAISNMVAEQVTSQEQENAEVMLKSEKLSVIICQFLPCGQLLFLNHKVRAQLERQVEKLLMTK